MHPHPLRPPSVNTKHNTWSQLFNCPLHHLNLELCFQTHLLPQKGSVTVQRLVVVVCLKVFYVAAGVVEATYN